MVCNYSLFQLIHPVNTYPMIRWIDDISGHIFSSDSVLSSVVDHLKLWFQYFGKMWCGLQFCSVFLCSFAVFRPFLCSLLMFCPVTHVVGFSQGMICNLFSKTYLCIYVVVQFCPWFKFYFPLFLGMVMYDSELKQRKIKLEPEIKLEPNIYICDCLTLATVNITTIKTFSFVLNEFSSWP